MSTQQQTVLKAVKDLSRSLPNSGKVEVLNHLLTELSSEDLTKLSPAARQALLQALPTGDKGSNTSSKIAPTATTPSASMELAEKILSSLEIGKDGFAKLVIPANVSDIDAMKALNVYFREKLPGRNRAAIWEGDFTWCAKQSSVSSRDISKERHIEINVLVDGTLGKTRSNQIKALTLQGLSLGAPEEVALVVAAYACKNQGKDLLNDNWTRTAVPGVALTTDQDSGVDVRGHCDGGGAGGSVGASGVRSSPN